MQSRVILPQNEIIGRGIERTYYSISCHDPWVSTKDEKLIFEAVAMNYVHPEQRKCTSTS
jgi:hypothetical protein